MTTKPLGKMYHTLTAAERGPLLIAAIARGDETEQQRILGAATSKGWRLADTFGFGFALNHVFRIYERTQFELLAQHFFARAHWMYAEVLMSADAERLKRDFPDFDPDSKDRLDLKSLDFMADVSGYRFCVNEAAWSLFRGELRIGPDVLLVEDTLFDLAIVRMPEEAPSADELLARYPSRFPPNDDGTPCQLVTPPTVAAGWRDLFHKLSGHWA